MCPTAPTKLSLSYNYKWGTTGMLPTLNLAGLLPVSQQCPRRKVGEDTILRSRKKSLHSESG